MKLTLYKFIKPEYLFPFIQTGRLKLSRLGETNDPFEYLPSVELESHFKSAYRRQMPDVKELVPVDMSEEQNQLIDAFVSLRSVMEPYASLSLNCSCPLMWAHYADNHHGACLVFEIEFEDEKGNWPGTHLRLIHYTNERYQIWPAVAKPSKPEMAKYFSALLNYKGCVEKAHYWSYEQELRVFVHEPNQIIKRNEILFYHDARPYLKGVIIGTQSSISLQEVKEELQLYNYHQQVTVCNARMSPDQYLIVNDFFLDIEQKDYSYLQSCFRYSDYQELEHQARLEAQLFFDKLIASEIEKVKQGLQLH